MRVGVVGPVGAGKTSMHSRLYHESWLERLAEGDPEMGAAYQHRDDDRHRWHRELGELRNEEQAHRAQHPATQPADGIDGEFKRLRREPRRINEGDMLKAIARVTGHVYTEQSSTVVPIIHDMTTELSPDRVRLASDERVLVHVVDTPGIGATIGDKLFDGRQLEDMVHDMCTAETPLLDFIVVVLSALEPVNREKRQFIQQAHEGLCKVVEKQACTTSVHHDTETRSVLDNLGGADATRLREVLRRSEERADSMAPGRDGRDELIARAATERMLVVLTNSDRARPAEIMARRREISSGDEAVLPGVAVVAASAVGWDGDPDGEKVPTWYNTEDPRVGDLLGSFRRMIANGSPSVVDCHTIDMLTERVAPELREITDAMEQLGASDSRSKQKAKRRAAGGALVSVGIVVTGAAASAPLHPLIIAAAAPKAAVIVTGVVAAGAAPFAAPLIIGGAVVGVIVLVGGAVVNRRNFFGAKPPEDFQILAVRTTGVDIGFRNDPDCRRVQVELRSTGTGAHHSVRYHDLEDRRDRDEDTYRLGIDGLEAATVYAVRIAVVGPRANGVFTPWLAFKTHAE